MATQGLVSVLKDGHVILKAVAGCDGYYAQTLAKRIKRERLTDIDSIYQAAIEIGFGGEDTLVVMDEQHIRYRDDEGDTVSPLYRKTFYNPSFNPRWEHGTVDSDCLAIVQL